MPFLRGEFDFECFMIIYGNQEQLRNEYACFILVAPSLLKTLVPAPTVCQLKSHASVAKLEILERFIFNKTKFKTLFNLFLLVVKKGSDPSIPLKEQKQYRVSPVSPVTLFYRIGLNITCPFEFRRQGYVVPISGLLAPDFAIAGMLEEGAKFPFG